jgi:WD40 repeat protein
VATGKTIHELKGHTDPVYSADFSPTGRLIVTASLDRTIRIWDAISGRGIQILRGHDEGVNSAEFDYSGKFIVTSSDDKTTRIWDVGSGRVVYELPVQPQPVIYSSFSPHGNSVAIATGNVAQIYFCEVCESEDSFWRLPVDVSDRRRTGACPKHPVEEPKS